MSGLTKIDRLYNWSFDMLESFHTSRHAKGRYYCRLFQFIIKKEI